MTQIAHGDATLIDRVHAQYTTCVVTPGLKPLAIRRPLRLKM